MIVRQGLGVAATAAAAAKAAAAAGVTTKVANTLILPKIRHKKKTA